MLRMIEQTRDEELSCDELLLEVDRYAEMVMCGENPSAVMPLVQHHLKNCPDCQEEFEALLRILKAVPDELEFCDNR